jgi:hypothetical protein
LKNIAIITEENFMRETIDSCMRELLSTNQYKIQVISWSNSFRKSFAQSPDIDLYINLTSHSFHNKNYKGDNLIQVPFLQNLKGGISRELYQSIIRKEDGINIPITKTNTGKQSFIVCNSTYYLFHHSYSKSFSSIVRKIPELVKDGTSNFFNRAERKTIFDNQYPKVIPIVKYNAILLFRTIIHLLKVLFTYDHWKVAVCDFSIQEVCRNKELLLKVKSLSNPGGKDFIADPFGFQSGGNDYIIYERFERNKNKGILEIRKNEFKKPFIKIEKGEHLSYPYIYEENGDIYMIPECHQSGEILLYKWSRSNEEFEFDSKILEGFNGIDNSLVKHNNKYWLFSNNADNKSADISLNIYYADTLRGPYKAHPLNPVISSITHSRPAGTIFRNEEQLIRPSQNSGITYGGSIQLNQILKLTETEYEEKTIDSITPADLKRKHIKGIHTISSMGGKTLIDYKYKRLKIGSIRF